MAIKKIIRIIFVVIITITQVDAQSTKANLDKYWLYRERLRKYFVVVNSNPDAFGTNIPFSYSQNHTILQGGDGNDELQYYIGMLATEYALLKRYGKDYWTTRNELLYALQAVERLDKYAENYYRQDASSDDNDPTIIDVRPEDLNGFFVRDDIGSRFPSIWQSEHPSLKNVIVQSCFTDGNTQNVPYEESKDNVWNYIPNLALVTALVDDDEIDDKAKQITQRMINLMHVWETWVDIPDLCPIGNCSFSVGERTWDIKNPVTNKVVVQGGKVEEIGKNTANQDGFAWGFAQSGYTITGVDLQYGNSSNENGTFLTNFYDKNSATAMWAKLLLGILGDLNVSPYMSANSWLSLGTVGVNNSDLQTNSHDNTATVMNRLLSQLQSTNESKYEHLPLIRILLDQSNSNLIDNYSSDVIEYAKSYNSVNSFYLNLLNIAPNCGPVNIYTKHEDPSEIDEWGMGNRLTMSDKLVTYSNGSSGKLEIDNSQWFGYYNGIDYLGCSLILRCN